MRIANHSLLLKPTFMYLLHFAGKAAKKMGEVGVFFQELRDLCLVGECQQLTSCKHPFDILSQCSELRPEQTPQTPDTEESSGKWAAALPTDLHKSTPELTGAAGNRGCLLSRAWGPLGTADSGCHPYRRDTGRNSGRQELSWRENPSTVIPAACLL